MEEQYATALNTIEPVVDCFVDQLNLTALDICLDDALFKNIAPVVLAWRDNVARDDNERSRNYDNVEIKDVVLDYLCNSLSTFMEPLEFKNTSDAVLEETRKNASPLKKKKKLKEGKDSDEEELEGSQKQQQLICDEELPETNVVNEETLLEEWNNLWFSHLFNTNGLITEGLVKFFYQCNKVWKWKWEEDKHVERIQKFLEAKSRTLCTHWKVNTNVTKSDSTYVNGVDININKDEEWKLFRSFREVCNYCEELDERKRNLLFLLGVKVTTWWNNIQL